MDFRQLKYFIAVAEERNISRAAARLYISQPPLTRHIQAMEEELDVKLFTRTTWGVELTEAGQSLLKHAHNIKAHVELATEQARRAGKGLVGRIDVGVFGSAMLNIIPRILNRFRCEHPDVSVVLHSAPKLKQVEALHQGRILIAFDRHFPESSGLTVELVEREAILVALNKRNPLSAKSSIHVHDLRNEPMIGELDPCVFSVALPLFLQAGFEPLFAQRATDMVSAAVMVAGGFGSTLVPESTRDLQLPDVVYRPLVADGQTAQIDLHCAYRKNEFSPQMGLLLRTVREFREQNHSGVELDGCQAATDWVC